MYLRQTLVAFLLVLLSACQQTNQTNTATENKIGTLEDSLYKAVIGFHDEVMPKMGKIQGYQKTVQAKIDSLTKALVHQKNETGHELKSHYESLLVQLQAAEKGMNDWMDNFEPEPKLPSKEEREKYWQDEYAKAKKMRDDFKAALESAGSVLEK